MTARSFKSDPPTPFAEQIAEHERAIETYTHLNELARKRLDSIEDLDLNAIQATTIVWNDACILHHQKCLAYVREKEATQ